MSQKYDPEEECEKLMKQIKRIYEVKGLSARSFAKKAEIATSTWHDLVNGKTKPYIHTVYKLCNALDISIVSLIKSSSGTQEEKMNEKETELVEIYRNGTEKQKRLLEMYVETLAEKEEKRD